MPVGRVWHPFLSHKGSAPDHRKAPVRLMCAVAHEQRSPSTHIIPSGPLSLSQRWLTVAPQYVREERVPYAYGITREECLCAGGEERKGGGVRAASSGRRTYPVGAGVQPFLESRNLERSTDEGREKTSRNSNRESRKLTTKERPTPSPYPLPSPRAREKRACCPWRPQGTPPLFNWCWCVHPMRAGAADQRIRRPVSSGGRMKGMRHRWMRFEPYRPQAYFRTPEGIRRKDRRIGRIPFMRPATPRAFICPCLCILPLAPLSLRP